MPWSDPRHRLVGVETVCSPGSPRHDTVRHLTSPRDEGTRRALIGRARRRLWFDRAIYLRRLRAIGVAVVAFLAAFFFTQWWDFTIPSLRGEYQAVFLTNGQTYFGRYYDRIGAYAKIEDVYYIQQAPSADATQTADARLVRRGTELHAPDPRMLVPKSAILFVEDLRPDSPISTFMRQDHR